MLMNMVCLKELFSCSFQPLHTLPVAQRKRGSETGSFLQCVFVVILLFKVILGLTGPIWDPPLAEDPPSPTVKLCGCFRQKNAKQEQTRSVLQLIKGSGSCTSEGVSCILELCFQAIALCHLPMAVSVPQLWIKAALHGAEIQKLREENKAVAVFAVCQVTTARGCSTGGLAVGVI